MKTEPYKTSITETLRYCIRIHSSVRGRLRVWNRTVCIMCCCVSAMTRLSSLSILHIITLWIYALAYTPVYRKLTPGEIAKIEGATNQKSGVLQAYLDYGGKYDLRWEYDNDTITFDVTVQARGWIGLGFTPNHGMTDADIVLVWIDGNGEAHISDRHAKGNEYPKKDQQQDYTLLSASRSDTHMKAKIRRLRNTCDKEGDYRLTADSTRVIWAFSDAQPEDEDHFEKHAATNRGVKGLFLFDPPADKFKLAPDTVTLDLLSGGARLPTDHHMMYWCQIFEMPKWPVHHVIRFDGIVESGHEPYVHHIGLYQCSKNMSEFLGKGDKCFTGDGFNYSKMYECATKLLWFWSPGMKPSDMPEGVGFPVFESPADTYVMMEVHYENIDRTPGILDHSGLRLYMTPTLRPVEAGTMFLGTVEQAPNQLLPPGEEDFHFYAHFDNCFAQLPSLGIKLLSSMLHEHLYGKRIRMHHYRNGVQLPDFSIDDNYDFYSQSFRKLDPPRVVLPGDEVVLECVYNTTRSNQTIYGGFSTLDEMCDAPHMYYPRVGRGFICLSYPDPHVYVPMFGAQLIDNDTVLLPSNENVTLYEFVKHHLDWDKPGVREQYKELVSNGQYLQQFYYQPLKKSLAGQNATNEEEPPVEAHTFTHNGYPNVTQPWIPEAEVDECAITTQKPATGKTSHENRIHLTEQSASANAVSSCAILVSLAIGLLSM